ncbi:hypothetical protein M431DRAFT_503346, partial [Trichoderma harzianum CBS 226.95]
MKAEIRGSRLVKWAANAKPISVSYVYLAALIWPWLTIQVFFGCVTQNKIVWQVSEA